MDCYYLYHCTTVQGDVRSMFSHLLGPSEQSQICDCVLITFETFFDMETWTDSTTVLHAYWYQEGG